MGRSIALLDRPNVARILGDGLALGTSWAVQTFLWQLHDTDGRARHSIRICGMALLGALVAMTVCFVQIPVAREDIDLVLRHPADPFVLGYRLAFLSYLGVALVNVARLSRRYARGAARPSMRLGLRLVAGGALLGLLYAAHEALWVLAPRLGLSHLLSSSQTLPRLLMASGIGLMVLGSTLPGWGPRIGLDLFWHWLATYRSLVRLYPLWHDLCLELPHIALFPPRSPLTDRLNPRDVSFRLCRRVVEIRDGLLPLRPVAAAYVAADASRGRTGALGVRVAIEAATEAIGLLEAIWQPEHHGEGPAVPAPWDSPAGADFAAEVTALERLARWYRRPEAMRLLRQWLAEAGAATERRKAS